MNPPFNQSDPKEKIILALDFDAMAKVTPWVEALAPHVGYFKVGLELMQNVGTPQIVQQIHRLGGHIFFDGKFHDIPNTVGAAARAVSGLGVKMFNVHASAGKEAIAAAAENKGQSKLLVVTVLTSLDEAMCQQIYGMPVKEKVISFAKEAKNAGADGVICSAQEVEWLGAEPDLKDLMKVTPGIRPSWAQTDDQKRVLTPSEAIRVGSTHLVIGRPIMNPPRGIGGPLEALKSIMDEIQAMVPPPLPVT